jgi:hypothetical protein
MRTILALAVLGLLLPLVPPAAATPTCQVLDRAQTLGGVQVHLHSETCVDSYSYYGYTTDTWTNNTYVEAFGSAGHPVVYENNWHSITTGPSGYYYESRNHNYGVNDAPPGNPAATAASVGASDYQQTYGSTCSEGTGAGAYSYGASQSNGVGQYLYGGSDPSYVLPCTSSDVQSTLP